MLIKSKQTPQLQAFCRGSLFPELHGTFTVPVNVFSETVRKIRIEKATLATYSGYSGYLLWLLTLATLATYSGHYGYLLWLPTLATLATYSSYYGTCGSVLVYGKASH